MRDVYLLDGNKNKVSSIRVNKKGYCHMNVKNTGTKKASGPFWNQCWLSDGKKFDGKDNAENLGKDDMDDLDNGKSRSSDEDFDGIEWPGTYNFVGCTDIEKKVTESNEKDNCNVGDGAVKQEFVFEVVSSPNLQTTAINLTNGKTVLSLNETFAISSITFNAGENFGPRYVYIGYFVDGTLVGQNQIRRENMKGGVSKVEEVPLPGGISTVGTHEIKACADYNNGIVETNETDNCLAMTVAVGESTAIDPNRFYPCPVITQANWSAWSGLGHSAPFSADGTNLINPSCKQSQPNSLELTIGNANNPNVVSYMTAYIRNKTTGADMQFPLTCSGLVNNGWCAGTATLTVENTGINTASSSDPTLIFGYACELVNGAFQCPPYWQIQGAGLPPQ